MRDSRRRFHAGAGGLALAALVLLVPRARAGDDALALGDAELKDLVKGALSKAVAAVCTQGPARLALDDKDVVCEGAHVPAPGELVVALKEAAAAAKLTLIKHGEDLAVPMLRVRASALTQANAVQTRADHSLYMEIEAPNREVIHAQLDGASKAGPGGKDSGAYTSASLDAVADKVLRDWSEARRPTLISVISNPRGQRPPSQESLTERILVRMLHKVTLVAGARTNGPDVPRPPKLPLLTPTVGLLVSVLEKGSQSAVLVEGVDLTTKKQAFLFRDPEPKSKDSDLPRPLALVKSTATSLVFKLQGNGYPHKKGERVKVWLCEARVEKGIDVPQDLPEQMTKMLRDTLGKQEMVEYGFEPHDGAVSAADAKAKGVYMTFTPVIFSKKGKNRCGIEIADTSKDGSVLEVLADFLHDKKP